MSLFQSISGFISSAIVGGPSGSGTSGSGHGDHHHHNQHHHVTTSSSTVTTPLSDGVTPFFQAPPMCRSRNPSGASSAQHSPVAMAAPPSLDLSHLSEEERRQIEAVIARAKDIHEGGGAGGGVGGAVGGVSGGVGGVGVGGGVGIGGGGAAAAADFAIHHRQRDFQEERSARVSASAIVPTPSPNQTRRDPPPEPEVPLHTCAVCSETRMTDSGRKVCVDCRRNICNKCGSNSTDQGFDEWLCNICHKRREIVTATTRWKASQQQQQASNPIAIDLTTMASASSSSSSSSASQFFAQFPMATEQVEPERKAELASHRISTTIGSGQPGFSESSSFPPQRIVSAPSQASKPPSAIRRQTSLPFEGQGQLPAEVTYNRLQPSSPLSPPSPPSPSPPPSQPLPPSKSQRHPGDVPDHQFFPDAFSRDERQSTVTTEHCLGTGEESIGVKSEARALPPDVAESGEFLAEAEIEKRPEEHQHQQQMPGSDESDVTGRRSRPHQLQLSPMTSTSPADGVKTGNGEPEVYSTQAKQSTVLPSVDFSPQQEMRFQQFQQQQQQQLQQQRQQRDSSSSSSSCSSSSSSSASSSPAVASATGASPRTKSGKSTASISSRSVADAVVESSKRKPSALDRVALAGHHDFDRNQSPSRRSPKSPPRSPSWMRYRDSPPRSPPFRVLSPSVSPTERFVAERTSESSRTEDPHGYVEEYEISLDENDSAFNFDTPLPLGPAERATGGAEEVGVVEYGSYSLTMKPSRFLIMDQLGCDIGFQSSTSMIGDASPIGDTLASFAASIANDTAFLTSLSVSPMVEVQRSPAFGFELSTTLANPEPVSHLASRQPEEPTSLGPGHVIELAEPTPKSIDCQNSKRQKSKPPTADWSPVSDLSPILDVSPSLERIEQEKMMVTGMERIQQPQQQVGGNVALKDGEKESGAVLAPCRSQSSIDDGPNRQSALKRAPRLEDISGFAGRDEQGRVMRDQGIATNQIQQNKIVKNVEPTQINREPGRTSGEHLGIGRERMSLCKGQGQGQVQPEVEKEQRDRTERKHSIDAQETRTGKQNVDAKQCDIVRVQGQAQGHTGKGHVTGRGRGEIEKEAGIDAMKLAQVKTVGEKVEGSAKLGWDQGSRVKATDQAGLNKDAESLRSSRQPTTEKVEDVTVNASDFKLEPMKRDVGHRTTRSTGDSTNTKPAVTASRGAADRDGTFHNSASLGRERFDGSETLNRTSPEQTMIRETSGAKRRELPVPTLTDRSSVGSFNRVAGGNGDVAFTPPDKSSVTVQPSEKPREIIQRIEASQQKLMKQPLRPRWSDGDVAAAGAAADDEDDADAERTRRHLPVNIIPGTVRARMEELQKLTRQQSTEKASLPASNSSSSKSHSITSSVSSASVPAHVSPSPSPSNIHESVSSSSSFSRSFAREIAESSDAMGCGADRTASSDSESPSLQRSSLTTRSPGSPADSNRKPRRRLPSLPPEADSSSSSSPRQLRRVRSRSADSRAEERNQEKERLRRCLRMREIEQRRSFDKDDADAQLQQQQPHQRSRTGSWNGEDQRTTSTRKSRVDSMLAGPPRRTPGSSGSGSAQRSWFAENGINLSQTPDTRNSFGRRQNDEKGRHFQTGNSMSKFSVGGERGKPKLNPKVKPVEMVTIRGVQVPVEVKSLKQRIREELQIVTATRRLRLDEDEEVRRMEAEMAERERLRRQKAEIEANEEADKKKKKKEQEKKQRQEQMERARQVERSRLLDQSQEKAKLGSGKSMSSLPGSSGHSTIPRISPHASPRRARHRRQNSDPMIAKFSPIEEDRDIETELRYHRQQLSSEARRLAASLANYTSPIPTRRHRKYTAGLSHPTAFEETLKRYYNTPSYGSLSRSSDLLAKRSMSDKEARMSSSQSESCLPMTSRSKTPTYFSDDDDVKNKEEKKLLLQMEIGLRKRQLEETKLLQKEIQRLVEMPDISPFEMEKARLMYQQHLRSRDDMVNAGIIRPIDYQIKKDKAQRTLGKAEVQKPRAATLQHPVRQSSSSDSSDYLTHRTTSSDLLLSRKLLADSGRAPDVSGSHLVRSTSEHSLADSDEYIMEGGVTIRRRKKPKVAEKVQPETQPLRQYDFPTKRILLTRDPKDKSLQGNGIGVKIVGGKIMADKNGELGAFVTTIFRGGVADQLHGELREGDQVLEWNGIALTGKTFEEVQQIMSQPNGEIELVIRTNESSVSSKPSSSVSTIQTDSRRSSYDNLEAQSDYDECGVLKRRRSPGVSPNSSQQDLQTGSSMSTSGSSDPTDVLSATIREQERHAASAAGDKAHKRSEKDLGEIQLQLSYDNYDGALNVHVIQARRLQPKDANGYSDPYVKLYLLPSRSSENKRRTRYISKTLDPEWYQTFVFMGIPRNDISHKTLDVTVWDYDRFKPNDFLGQVILNLSDTSYLDNRPHWYPLQKLNAGHLMTSGGKFDSFSHHGNNQPGGTGGGHQDGSRNPRSPPSKGHGREKGDDRSGTTTGRGGTGSLSRRQSSSPEGRHRTTGYQTRNGQGHRGDVEAEDRRNDRHTDAHTYSSRRDEKLPRQYSTGSTLSTKSDVSDRYSLFQTKQPKVTMHPEEKFFGKLLRDVLLNLIKSIFCCQRRMVTRFQHPKEHSKEQIVGFYR